jgi:Na+-transporting NADH:ubiquinone oxidoreductase subunit NqrD
MPPLEPIWVAFVTLVLTGCLVLGRAGVSAPTRAPLRLVRRAGFWATRPVS